MLPLSGGAGFLTATFYSSHHFITSVNFSILKLFVYFPVFLAATVLIVNILTLYVSMHVTQQVEQVVHLSQDLTSGSSCLRVVEEEIEFPLHDAIMG